MIIARLEIDFKLSIMHCQGGGNLASPDPRDGDLRGALELIPGTGHRFGAAGPFEPLQSAGATLFYLDRDPRRTFRLLTDSLEVDGRKDESTWDWVVGLNSCLPDVTQGASEEAHGKRDARTIDRSFIVPNGKGGLPRSMYTSTN
jgi:hypothetical protein